MESEAQGLSRVIYVNGTSGTGLIQDEIVR
jgi:hypothetical protein